MLYLVKSRSGPIDSPIAGEFATVSYERQTWTAAPRRNALWTFERCQISYDEIYLFQERREYFPSECSEDHSRIVKWVSYEHWKKNTRKFPVKFEFYREEICQRLKLLTVFFLWMAMKPAIESDLGPRAAQWYMLIRKREQALKAYIFIHTKRIRLKVIPLVTS